MRRAEAAALLEPLAQRPPRAVAAHPQVARADPEARGDGARGLLAQVERLDELRVRRGQHGAERAEALAERPRLGSAEVVDVSSTSSGSLTRRRTRPSNPLARRRARARARPGWCPPSSARSTRSSPIDRGRRRRPARARLDAEHVARDPAEQLQRPRRPRHTGCPLEAGQLGEVEPLDAERGAAALRRHRLGERLAEPDLSRAGHQSR